MFIQDEPHNLDELTDLILMASKSDFFFSHRIWFYFRSAIFNDLENQDKVADLSFQVLQGLKTVCLDSEEEKLYIANSKEIIGMII